MMIVCFMNWVPCENLYDRKGENVRETSGFYHTLEECQARASVIMNKYLENEREELIRRGDIKEWHNVCKYYEFVKRG